MTLLPPELSTPIAIAVIALLVAVGYHYQKGLTYREYTEIQRFKPRLFVLFELVTGSDSKLKGLLKKSTIPIINRLSTVTFDSFIHEKEHPENEDEYYTTTNASPKTVWRRLKQAGFSPHLISSTKRRPDGSLSKWHWVYTHEDGTQSEAYLFQDGALYIHHETVATDVEGHLSDGITPGDPRGTLDGVEL